MSQIRHTLLYAKRHEWARQEEGGEMLVGIIDYAQDALGDVVYVELPEVVARVEGGLEAGVFESVKAAADICAPVSGEVVTVNPALEERPELLNESPYDDGWLFRLRPEPEELDEDLDKLLDAEAYRELCEEQED